MVNLSKARKAIESLYNGVCDIVEYQSVSDPETHLTTQKEVTILQNQPCKLSVSNITSAGNGSTAIVQKVTKLFISPDVEIKSGCKIIVTQNGRTEAYSRSGIPRYGINHQEIILQLFQGWS